MTNEEKILASLVKAYEKIEQGGKLTKEDLTLSYITKASKVSKGSVGAAIGRLVAAKALRRHNRKEGEGFPWYSVTGKPYKSSGRGKRIDAENVLDGIHKRTLAAFKKGLDERCLRIFEARIEVSPPSATMKDLAEELEVSIPTINTTQRKMLDALANLKKG